MFQAFLAAGVLWCLLAGRLPAATLAAVCLAVLLGGWLLRRRWHHDHDHWTSIDFYALRSRLASVPAGLKALLCLIAIVVVLAAQSPLVSAVALVLAFLLTVWVGRTPVRLFLQLYATPLAFVLLSGVALLFDFTAVPMGPVAIRLFGRYLCVTAQTQAQTLRILLGATASVAWLYALCLSTPMPALITALERVHLPALFIELMYLIYRYIFVLSDTMTRMKTAAAARLGFTGFRAAFRSTGCIMTGLLAASFQKASASFDAMQSRCYAGRLRFLQESRPLRPAHVLGSCAVVAVLALTVAAERMFI
jgi:cobalt/nickel transport system permease protein